MMPNCDIPSYFAVHTETNLEDNLATSYQWIHFVSSYSCSTCTQASMGEPYYVIKWTLVSCNRNVDNRFFLYGHCQSIFPCL